MSRSIVDEFPYPFDQPMAQALLRFMVGEYPLEDDALRFVETHGIDPAEVPRGRSPLNLWHRLLEEAAKVGSTRAIVKATRERHPRNPRAAFLDALLVDKVVPVRADLGDGGEPPPFVVGDDRVTEQEALLFFDDLTMEAGKVPALIETLQRVLAKAASVCLLRVENPAGQFFGTGFRIAPDLVLTNEHVLFPKTQVAAVVHVDFDFDVAVDGASLATVALRGDPATIVGHREDDWAVVRVAGMGARPIVDLADAPAPRTNDLAYILQHPGAQRKRLGFVRNTISNVTDRVVHYLTDTQSGSSGAPVFDAAGRVIALHHAGGIPTPIAGTPPLSKNEGIRISRVLAGLRAKGVVAA
jgi:S1-C subfamily serine protease